jgi:hypothetical protein
VEDLLFRLESLALGELLANILDQVIGHTENDEPSQPGCVGALILWRERRRLQELGGSLSGGVAPGDGHDTMARSLPHDGEGGGDPSRPDQGHGGRVGLGLNEVVARSGSFDLRLPDWPSLPARRYPQRGGERPDPT